MLKLHLAPMEGLIDWVFRDTLTAIGGIDQCVTEFVRVTDRVVVDHVFYESCPELKSGCHTRAGVPVLVQLLGGHPEPLAASAVRAVELGACGIDLNFGCPAKTVNRHDGGATLLKYPERIHGILQAVRKALPTSVPVTAKIRLGFDHPAMCLPVAEAVEAAGIATMTVHCRTKTDMYKPPAYWEWIPKIKAITKLNIVANGEIWTVEDFARCRRETGCDEIMIGRGAIANPFLFLQIKKFCAENELFSGAETWSHIQEYLPPFYQASASFKNESYAVSRTKQWLAQISKRDSAARPAFEQLKLIMSAKEFSAQLNSICEQKIGH